MLLNTNNNGVIYLSGGMEKTSSDDPLGAKWRIVVSERLKKMNFIPLDITAMDKAYTKEHGDLFYSFGSSVENLVQMKSNVRKHFVHADLRLIVNNSDALILLYDESVRRGAGTISESQVAFNHDVPIFIVNKFGTLAELPGWLTALSTKIFSSFDELYDYLSSLPEGILHRDLYGNKRSGNHYLCSLCGDPFEKNKTHFVSKVSPLYCNTCVDVVKYTIEEKKCRYEFFIEHLTNQFNEEN